MADMWRWGGGGSVAHLIQQATQKKLLTGLDIFAFMLKKRFLFVYVIEGPLKWVTLDMQLLFPYDNPYVVVLNVTVI